MSVNPLPVEIRKPVAGSSNGPSGEMRTILVGDFGKRLAAARRAKGLSQEALATEINFTRFQLLAGVLINPIAIDIYRLPFVDFSQSALSWLHPG